MLTHLLRTKLRGYRTVGKRLVGEHHVMESILNDLQFKNEVVVHQGLLNIEDYFLEALILAAKQHKFNFFFRK